MAISASAENHSMFDLEQILTHFISEKNSLSCCACDWQGARNDQKAIVIWKSIVYRKHQVLIEGCLEVPYLLFSINIPHYQGI